MNTDNLYADGLYLECNPTWHEEDSPWKAGQIAKILTRNNIKPSTVCEAGCGAGEILNSLARQYGDGVSFSGYEVSPQAFAICHRKQGENLKFYLIKDLGEIKSQFDVVMAIDVEDYFGFLRQLRTKGTYKIFHIPLDLSVQWLLRASPILKQRTSVGHLHYFMKDTALATLKDTGYEIIDYFYTGNGVELPNRGWKANLLKLPRKLFFAVNQDLAVRILGGYSLLVLAK